jgi:hypothetical protein
MSNSDKLELLIQNDQEEAVFTYLFQLQESGKTNMFGAAAYIIRQPQFSNIDLNQAVLLVNKWIENYKALQIAVKLPKQTTD